MEEDIKLITDVYKLSKKLRTYLKYLLKHSNKQVLIEIFNTMDKTFNNSKHLLKLTKSLKFEKTKFYLIMLVNLIISAFLNFILMKSGCDPVISGLTSVALFAIILIKIMEIIDKSISKKCDERDALIKEFFEEFNFIEFHKNLDIVKEMNEDKILNGK